jgi:hypothetical protein
MQRIALLIIIAVILVSLALAQSSNDQSILIRSALAQESGESVTEEAAQDELDPEPEDEAAAAEEPDEEAAVVDDEFYQDADDEDFIPSEDIPADQSIPFPTDI